MSPGVIAESVPKRAILEELRLRKIERSSNGPVGDYAEYLFAKAFEWELVGNSQKGYDAKDRNSTNIRPR